MQMVGQDVGTLASHVGANYNYDYGPVAARLAQRLRHDDWQSIVRLIRWVLWVSEWNADRELDRAEREAHAAALRLARVANRFRRNDRSNKCRNGSRSLGRSR